jgi:hypothetical protein
MRKHKLEPVSTFGLIFMLIAQTAFGAGETHFPKGIISQGSVAVGTVSSANSKTVLDVVSTTKGARPCPSMTGTQRDAIASPATGSCVFNTDTGKYNAYNGSAWSELGGSGAGGIFAGGQNLISNNSYETDTTGWTASAGTFARTTTAGQYIPPGVAGASWAATGGAGRTLCYTATTINANDGLAGRSGAVSIAARAGSGTATHLLYAYDGTNILGSTTITSSTTQFARSTVNFPMPSSGTIQACIKSVSGTEPTLYFDDWYLGLAEGFNLSQASQAQFYGSATWVGTANCSWSTTAAIGNFSADSDCTTPVGSNLKGNASAPATKVPGISFATMPQGDYYFVANGYFYKNGTASSAVGYRFSDGTNTSNEQFIGVTTSNNLATGTITGHIYESSNQSNVTVQIQGEGGGGDAAKVEAWTIPLEIYVYYFPSSSQTAYRSDQMPMFWSGYHDTTCAWTNTSTTRADFSTDASCALAERQNINAGAVTGSNTKPQITITLPRAGMYMVNATAMVSVDGNAKAETLYLSDGTNIIGNAVGQSPTGSSTAWTPFTFMGFENATAAGPVTFGIQGATTAGSTLTIGNINTAAITWNVIELSGGVPTPLLINPYGQHNGSEGAGTTTLTMGSNQTQITTLTAARTYVLPTTGVPAGYPITITNSGDFPLTVQASGGATVAVINVGSVKLISNIATPTVKADWLVDRIRSKTTLSTTWQFSGGSGGTTPTGATSTILERNGNFVEIYSPGSLATSGTSNTAFVANTAIQSDLRPASQTVLAFNGVRNNGGGDNGSGVFIITSGGIIKVQRNDTGTAFSNGVSCGFQEDFHGAYYAPL